MKRSHAIALGATGLILAGAWLGRSGNQRVDVPGALPESEAQAQIFTSKDECIAGRAPLIQDRNPDGSVKLGTEQLACDSLFKEAEANHVAAAPKFANQSECEKQYGASQCRSTTFNGAAVFVPAMVGLLVANHLLGRGQPQALLPARQQGAVPCPPGVTPAQQPGCLMPRQQTSGSSSSSSGSGWRSYSTSSGHTVSRNGAERSSTIPGNAAFAPGARTALGAAPVRASSAVSRSSSSSSSTTSRGGFGSIGRSSSSSS